MPIMHLLSCRWIQTAPKTRWHWLRTRPPPRELSRVFFLLLAMGRNTTKRYDSHYWLVEQPIPKEPFKSSGRWEKPWLLQASQVSDCTKIMRQEFTHSKKKKVCLKVFYPKSTTSSLFMICHNKNATRWVQRMICPLLTPSAGWSIQLMSSPARLFLSFGLFQFSLAKQQPVVSAKNVFLAWRKMRICLGTSFGANAFDTSSATHTHTHLCCSQIWFTHVLRRKDLVWLSPMFVTVHCLFMSVPNVKKKYCALGSPPCPQPL